MPRQYAASILHLDDSVGCIVRAIDSAGLKEQTLIVFNIDNGGSTAQNNDTQYPDDQYLNGPLTGNNLPYRGQKGAFYEGGTRVPTIARWPGKLPAGTACETPVHIVDRMPTFAALAKYSKDTARPRWDGTNIWPLLEGTGQLQERQIYLAGPGFQSRSLRDGSWKLIVFNGKRGSPEKNELFNISLDPAEKHDLSRMFLDKVIELHTKLNVTSASD